MLVSKKDILGFIAMWGVQQCTTKLPFEFEKTLLLINEHLTPHFADTNWGFKEFNRKELFEMLEPIKKIPEFYKWNLTKNEYNKGMDVDDPQRGQFKAVSRYDPYQEYSDNDFISLGALFGNVVRSIEREHERNEEFEKRFAESS